MYEHRTVLDIYLEVHHSEAVSDVAVAEQQRDGGQQRQGEAQHQLRGQPLDAAGAGGRGPDQRPHARGHARLGALARARVLGEHLARPAVARGVVAGGEVAGAGAGGVVHGGEAGAGEAAAPAAAADVLQELDPGLVTHAVTVLHHHAAQHSSVSKCILERFLTVFVVRLTIFSFGI